MKIYENIGTEFPQLFHSGKWSELENGTDPALIIVHICQGMSDPGQTRRGTRKENCHGQYFFDLELARVPGLEKYVDMNKFVIKEEFLGFTELLSTTGLKIKDVILKQIDAFGLSMTNLRGQGYDGGSNMSGINNGVQALILNEQPLALFTHCFNHVLNLVISKACNIPAIRNMFGIVGTVSVFLSASAKCNNILLNAISNDNNEPLPKKTKLRALCATRWVNRHDSIITFHELYKFILISLEELEKDTNREVSVKASSFNSSVKQSEFVVALETVANLFVYTSTEAILNAAMFYEQDLLSSSDLVLKAEINLWKTKWNKIETNIPHTAVTSLPYFGGVSVDKPVSL
ncbi:hypothetical protein QTP88_010239 [Uroleucon formosanum]